MVSKQDRFLFLFLFIISCMGQTSLAQSKKNTKNNSTQTKEKELKEVIVTATRTKRQLSSLPLPAQVVRAKEIENTNSIKLSDILNEQTGLITVYNLYGGGEGIQMQGLYSQYISILIDGVPLIGRLSGNLDLNRISLGNIKQIEIIKGASSSLYGNGALGGVINVITQDPKEGFMGKVNYRFGSFYSHDLSSNLSFKKEKLGFVVFLNRYNSEGYDLDEETPLLNTIDPFLNTIDPFFNYTYKAKLTYDFSEKTKASLSGRYYMEQQNTTQLENYYNSNSNLIRGEGKINEWDTHLKVHHKYNEKWASYLELYATRYKTKEYLNDHNGLKRFTQSYFNQFLLRPEIRTTYNPNENHALIGGLGVARETLERSSFVKPPEFNLFYSYLQYDAKPIKKLNTIVGARFDSHNEYGSQLSPKVAIRYELNDKIAIKSSVGYGFKAPDFRQLYFDFTNSFVGYTVLGYNAVRTRIPQLKAEGQIIGNVDAIISKFNDRLKPESSISYNLGVDYRPISTIKLNINAFRNDITNLIDTQPITIKRNLLNVYSYHNVDQVYTQGVEFNASWKPTNYLTFSGGYQLLFAKDKEVEDDFERGEVVVVTKQPQFVIKLKKEDYFGLLNRSRHMANLKLFFSVPKWGAHANIRGTYRGKYILYDTNSNTYLDKYDDFIDGYAIWDFAIHKNLYDNFQLGFGIDNALNFKAQNTSNIIPGRIIYGTINIKF